MLSISKKIQSYCCESDDHNVYSSIPIRCENEYKLVEQKLTKWSEHQHKLLNYAISMTDDAEVKRFLESLRNTSSNISADWSEEDEKLYTSALWHIKNSCSNGGKDSGEFEVYNWLKSIKDRIQPQPKQGWSEEDEECRKIALLALNNQNELKAFNWLRTLKPQSSWKPSEFQLKCLSEVIPQPDTEIGNELECALTELYDNLKKL